MSDFERIVDDLAEEKPPSLWTTHEICAGQTVWRNRVNKLACYGHKNAVMSTKTNQLDNRTQSMRIIWLLIICMTITGCYTLDRVDRTLCQFPDLVDEIDSTARGGMVEKRYQGRIMYFSERLFSQDGSISITSMYCGYGIGSHLVKVRIYTQKKNVEYCEGDYTFTRTEYISFRQECISTNDPMILMLEIRDHNGELSRNGYISQWESQEYFEKFIKENEVCIRWDPGNIITKKVDTYQKFQPIFPSGSNNRP